MKRVEIIIPVRNEAEFLEENIKKLTDFLKDKRLKYNYLIHIVESNSNDKTFEVAKRLSKKNKKIKATHYDKPGRDFCLRHAWMDSPADILTYMDADLSTDLDYFGELIKKIDEGYDVCVGSRLMKDSKLKRAKYRIFLSKVYNKVIIPLILPTGVDDAQCGFKAITPKVAKDILPKLEDHNAFLDTELLAVAKHKKLKIAEIAVAWEDKRESRMNVWKDIPNFLKNIIKTRIKIVKGFYD